MIESASDPHCMNCKKIWNKTFLDDSFPKSFINQDLKRHREDLLQEREQSLLPGTQPLVEQELHNRKCNGEIKELYKRRKQLQEEIQRINVGLREEYNNLHYGHLKETTEEKTKFVKKCPVEDCRGFLSTQWKCGICSTYVCSNCHEIKGEDRNDETHVCKEENIESAKLIAKETKPCPACGTRISKINGCDQMFCTSCQTPFSWRTGNKIISGTIHNPHYYEFMRQQNNGNMPRQFGDIPCGGLPNIYNLSTFSRQIGLSQKDERIATMYDIHRAISHLQYSELPRYEFHQMTNNTNSDLRVKYLLKEIDDKRFKQTLQQREKKNNKSLEVSQILQMYIDTSSELFRSVLQSTNIDEIEIFLTDINKLKDYYNTSIEPLSKRYNCVVPAINIDWGVFSTKY